MTTLYGLDNCDTCKKARKWLDRFGVAHAFVDYRDQRQSPETLVDWKEQARRLGRDDQQVVDHLAHACRRTARRRARTRSGSCC